MLLGPQERSSSKKRMGLNRWKRFTKKPSPKPAFDPDNVEHWIKRVEKASEFAVSNVFSGKKSDLPRRLWGQIIDLEKSEQIEDHDEVYAEAQELVNDWLDAKLRQELASDGEGDAEKTMSSITHMPEASGHLKYDKFDDLCGYLEEEEESTTIQKFIDHLLHKDVVDSGMLEDLGMKGNQDKKQQKDPRLTMEMRHKQVKENRLRREKELECQRMEEVLKKSAFLEAQYLVQEEKKRKALEAKKEEEEIQREMVKLRREIIERRHTVEEVWKMEKKRQDENSQKNPEKGMFQSAHILLDEEKMAKERKRKLKELLIQTFKENHQCQKRYFSAWHKLILDQRIKLGKAGTLSNWKFQLKVLRAWRDYTRSQTLKRETQALEDDLREENRKQQLAAEYNRKQVLRHCFTEWQQWHGAELIKRELALTKEETRKKMEELLKAVSLGKLSANGSSGISLLEEATATVGPPVGNGEVTAVPPLWEKPPSKSNGCIPRLPLGRTRKGNLQDPLQNTLLNTPDNKQLKTLDAEPSHQPGSNGKLGTTNQKAEPICMGHFHNRHVFQQQLIEKQKKKLQEQQKTILELKENQQLAEARWAAEHATVVTETQSRLLSNPRGEEEPKRTCQMPLNSPVASPGTEVSRSDSRNSLSGPRRNPKQLTAPHPILKAMEERAIQRAERRRILAERKKKQEEEKLAQLKAQEEECQKREAEEKQAQLERKREEKRLKKVKELEKQKRIKRNQQLEEIAKEHYKRVLIRKKGLEPWKRLRMQNKQNIQVAEEHHSLALQRKCLLTWFQHSQESLAGKTAQADQFYSQILLRRVFRSWLQYQTNLEEEVRKLCVHFLQKKIFQVWLNVVREAKVDSQSKHEIAAEHSDRRILWITFQTWKKFTKFMKEERVKEERREQLRRKVAEILPDFQRLAPW
ncbi:PREDICTED: coiled-coil domain-containing protein KIAA1407 homolog [Galeopterus variegatus]|uniref:Coiled-coil domain-containing protein KIAA1407 homolog n=1 Tax=Galeopterus variegatus TaxID=482537 RepID=A0ABM0RCM2_GALVR|nr:PREDICTED: coiled-coil domain-containing protein KIAA1407 homolog [Galeopterus variegatus]